MKNTAHEETYRDCKIELLYDEDRESPREWDNVGTMVCWHRRYNLGDEQPDGSPDVWFLGQVQGGHRWNEEKARREQAIRDDYRKQITAESDEEVCLNLEDSMDSDLDDVESKMEDDEGLCRDLFEKDHLVLPLYLYDHSGITMSTGKFSCPWDSGLVGFIYCSKERARQEWGEKYNPGIADEELWKKAYAYLDGEVETYDAYLTGQVVGYVAIDPDGEDIDSCWGFYPDEKGDWPDAIKQAKDAIDHWCDEQAKEAAEKAYWEARDTLTV